MEIFKKTEKEKKNYPEAILKFFSPKSHQKWSDISFFLHQLILLKQITSVFE